MFNTFNPRETLLKVSLILVMLLRGAEIKGIKNSNKKMIFGLIALLIEAQWLDHPMIDLRALERSN